jgi:hypothetical protein
MRQENTRIARSSRQVPVVRQDALLPPVERLRELVPEGPLEEGTTIEQRRAVLFWSGEREAVRR